MFGRRPSERPQRLSRLGRMSESNTPAVAATAAAGAAAALGEHCCAGGWGGWVPQAASAPAQRLVPLPTGTCGRGEPGQALPSPLLSCTVAQLLLS